MPGGESLAQVGWEGGRAAGTVASADVVEQGSWLVARLWNTPAVLTSTPLPAGRLRFVLSLDGEATIEHAGGSSAVTPHQFVVLDGREHVVTRNPVLWARMEWHLHMPLLRGSDLAGRVGRVLPIAPGYEQVIAAVTNTVCTAPRFGDGPGGLHLLPALQLLVTGALDDAHGVPSKLTPAQHLLVTRARGVIDQHFSDPSLSVADIANELSVSPAYLYRVFSLVGSTPRRELEQRRASAARLLLAASPARGKGTLESIARRAGFRTPRRMRAALESTESDADPSVLKSPATGDRHRRLAAGRAPGSPRRG